MISTRTTVTTLVLLALTLAACGAESNGASKIEPATLESIDGSEVSRVTLTPKAAERLGIATSQVKSEEVVRTRRFGGEVVDRPPGADRSVQMWVRVRFTEGELASVELDATANVYPVIDGQPDESVSFEAVADLALGAAADPVGNAYFAIDDAQSLPTGTAMILELPVAGSQRLVVPYGSVVYDPQGRTWTYTNPEPLVYVRHPIEIDYIDGDVAVLLEGPEPGTEVVSVGAGELSGFEAGVGG